MSETTHLALPRLEAAQAQKHVTVNEALQTLDLLVQLAVVSQTVTDPPAIPADGTRYLVPAGATGAWAGHEGEVAAWQDGVWRYLVPREGWRVFVGDERRMAVWLDGAWRATMVTGPAGEGVVLDMRAETHVLAVGPTSDTSVLIPERAILLGVTCLVSQPVTGATAFNVGVAADPQRFGSGIGVALNSQMNAPATPFPYWSDTAIRFTAQGSNFTGGTILVAAHFLRLQIPDFV